MSHILQNTLGTLKKPISDLVKNPNMFYRRATRLSKSRSVPNMFTFSNAPYLKPAQNLLLTFLL